MLVSSVDNASLSYFSRFCCIIVLYNVNRLKSGLRHILTIPIICIGLYTSCGIRVDDGNVCDICSHLSTSGETSIVQNVTPEGKHY